MGRLRDRIVCVTGASSGIGAASVRAFAAEGSRLLIAARRIDRLRSMEADLREAGAPAVHPIALDVRDPDAVAAAVSSLPDEWRAIEVLVNNAGLFASEQTRSADDIEDWEEMIDTNIKGLRWILC